MRIWASKRLAVVAGAIAFAVFVLLHWRVGDADTQRYTEILAQLAGARLIDARWDAAVLRSRSDPNVSAAKVVQPADANRVQRALELAQAHARSNALRTSIEELKSAYAEKADVVTRFQQASADSRQALEAAMLADAAVTNLVRSAWRDYPQRERLVAAENLVARVLTEAQQYHHAPNAASRAALQAAAVDLPRAHSLPRPVEAALTRLESDVHQVLLLKPLEQMLGDRLAALNTAERIDDLAETYQRHLSDALAQRSAYRAALWVYTILLLAGAVLVGLKLYRRDRALARADRVAAQEALVARAAEVEEPAQPEEDGSPDARSATVRFMRRP